MRPVPFGLKNLLAIDPGDHRAFVLRLGVAVNAKQDKRRHDQQEQETHRDLGVLANEIKHQKSPVRLSKISLAKMKKANKMFAFGHGV
jgi:hypothetical protein